MKKIFISILMFISCCVSPALSEDAKESISKDTKSVEPCREIHIQNRTMYMGEEGRLYPLKDDCLGLKRRLPIKSVTPTMGCYDSEPDKVRRKLDGSLPKGFVESTELFSTDELLRGAPREGGVYNLGIDWKGSGEKRRYDSFFFRVTIVSKEDVNQCSGTNSAKDSSCEGVKITMILSKKAAEYVKKAKEKGAVLFLS